MENDQELKPVRLAREVIYEDPWINLYADRVQFPNGKLVERHHIIEFEQESVAAIVENERGEILFVHAYRYTMGGANWELPAGRMERGESIIEAARREVLEESGYETTDHEMLYSFHPLNGSSTAVFNLVRCRAGNLVAGFDDEIAGICWRTLGQVEELIRQRQIKDGYALTGMLLHLRDRGE